MSSELEERFPNRNHGSEKSESESQKPAADPISSMLQQLPEVSEC